MEFLLQPASALQGRRIVAYGVRYPENALEQLRQSGIEYRGYLPNLKAPQVYSRSALTLHVPRRQYANGLSGIPTIRVFEALACGTPLVCSPWTDTENMFRPGQDYLCVPDGPSMRAAIEALNSDGHQNNQGAEQNEDADPCRDVRDAWYERCAHRFAHVRHRVCRGDDLKPLEPGQ